MNDTINMVMVGHVDHGKSTLIGRLIYEMGALPDGKYEQIVQSCAKRGVPFEWAYLMDALQAERAQNITIDITQFWLRTPLRDYVLIDAPGHHEFLRNMFTGAAEAELAILLVDSTQGMQEQTRKHAYLLHLLGINRIIVVINKMDKVGYSQDIFSKLAQECAEHLHQIGLRPLHIIPISAYHGEMLKERGENMIWYEGLSLLEAMEDYNPTPHGLPSLTLGAPALPQGESNSLQYPPSCMPQNHEKNSVPVYKKQHNDTGDCSPHVRRAAEPRLKAEDDAWGAGNPLRFCVQDVYRFDERRIIAGTILSGAMQVGDEILISPHNYPAQIATISTPNDDNAKVAKQGEAVGITLVQQRFVERGHVISHMISQAHDAPILSNQLYMRLFWLSATPLEMEGGQFNKQYKLRLHNSQFSAELRQIKYVLNTNDLQQSESDVVAQHQVAEVLWQLSGLACFDDYATILAMGRSVVVHEGRIVAAGLLTMLDANGKDLPNMRTAPKTIASNNLNLENMEVTAQQRQLMNGHSGGILWFTGLSGSGKSTLAKELQKQLFTQGYQTYVLDGDNIRQGLNADLGFSPEARSENIRRVGEVAALFADAGMVVITAFISPYAEDRRKARVAAPQMFHTVHIKAGVEACEQRDVKGLYKKARSGEIRDFTGVSAPYELPENPELVLDTERTGIDDCVTKLIDYVNKHFGKL